MLKSFSFFKSSLRHYSSINHSRVVIIGGGPGGLASANQLVNLGVIKPKEITIFDPEQTHYYQPAFTQLGGGVIDNNAFNDKFIRYPLAHLTKNFRFENSRIARFNPENNSVITDSEKEFFYDHLIVAAGLQVNFDSIEGLKELLEDENSNVGSIYNYKYALKTAELRKKFKGGKAVFTQPPVPLKCPGAPQKMMYLSHTQWKKQGIKTDIHYVTHLKQIFGVTYYSNSLVKIAEGRGHNLYYQTVLKKVEKDKAYFYDEVKKENFVLDFDFLHAVPNQGAPNFLKGSPISNPAGFVDVDFNMRHKKYSNIWAIGDCIALPNVKTAAAAFSQAPILCSNLANELAYPQKKTNLNEEEQKCPILNPQAPNLKNFPKRKTAIYDGYSACPLFVGEKKLMLCEFKTHFDEEKKEVVMIPDESFKVGKQTIPTTFFYYLSKSFLFHYKLGLYGKWFGKFTYLNPVNKKGEVVDVRRKYQILSSLAVLLLLLVPHLALMLGGFGLISLFFY